MFEFLFLLIRSPFALLWTVVVSVFWGCCLLVVLIAGLAWSVPLTTYCALRNDRKGLDEWLAVWGDALSGILKRWGGALETNWRFFTGQ